jgi:membrane-associated protein
LFLVIFCETGLVVTPFLPGDSLLFAAGMFAGLYPESLDIYVLLALLTIAAIIGDTVNYHVGKLSGAKLFQRENSRFFKRSYLDKTHKFFEKYGGKTIVLARFVPIVRTFAPFVAGMGSMTYSKFILYNVLGAGVWINLFIWAGYYLGRIPWVEKNFHSMTVLIILLSVVPIYLEVRKAKREEREALAEVAG